MPETEPAELVPPVMPAIATQSVVTLSARFEPNLRRFVIRRLDDSGNPVGAALATAKTEFDVDVKLYFQAERIAIAENVTVRQVAYRGDGTPMIRERVLTPKGARELKAMMEHSGRLEREDEDTWL
jgi:hypothetical protein